MDNINMRECIIKVKEEPNEDTKNVRANCLENVSEELEPLFAVFLQPREETEDHTLEKDPLAPSDDAGSRAPMKKEQKFQIPDAASGCSEVPLSKQHRLPAVPMEGRGSNKSAVGVLPGLLAEAAEPHVLPSAPRRSHTTLCQSDLSGLSGSDSEMRNSLIKKQYCCQNCSSSFTRLCQLKRHQQTSHIRLKPNKCSKMANSSSMNQQKISYSRSKKYKCKKCKFTAAKSTTLSDHRQIHSGLKLYKCRECDYKSSRSYRLVIHQRIHSGIKPYKCTECDFSYAQLSNLRRHQGIHSNI